MFNPTWFYVGALYAGAVWLARRQGIDLPRRIAVFFYALVFVFLYLPMTQDYVNLPVDFLGTLQPWSNLTRDHTPVNPDINDVVLQFVPWAHQVRESWKALEPPLWNHFSASGYPLLANGQAAGLSPLRLLALPLSLGDSMTAEAAMKILIGLTFTFLYCRRRGYSELASAFGAVSFGFSTFIIVWLHFPHVTTACFAPAVLYLIDLLAERRTHARFVCAAVLWVVMLFAGHPESASHIFFLALLYVLWLVVIERAVPWRFFLTLGGVMTVAALLASPFLLPFAEAVTKSERFQELDETPNAEVPFSDAESAVTLLSPHFYGQVPHEKPWGPAHAESISGFAGILGIAAWFAILAHIIMTRGWRSREMFFLVATVIVLGVIWSWPGINELFHLIYALAANARLRLLLVLLLAIQTAAAIDLWTRDRRALLIGVLAASVLMLIAFYGSSYNVSYHRDAAVLALLPSIGVLLLATVAAMTKREAVLLVVLTASIAELWQIGSGWNPTIEKKWMFPRTPLLEKMAEIQASIPKNEPFRIVGNGATFFPNSSAIYGLEDVRAHDPMAVGRYLRTLQTVLGYDWRQYFTPWPGDIYNHFHDYLNIRFLIASSHGELAPSQWVLRHTSTDGRIFENTTVLPRFYAARNVIIEFRDHEFDNKLRDMNEKWSHTALLDELKLENQQMHDDFFHPRPNDAPIATVEMLDAHPRDYRMKVKSPRYSLVVSSVPWWTGWKVERNGARIDPIRVNGAFLGFAVPEGEMDVRVWYDPWTWRVGVIASIATAIALIGFGLSATRSTDTRQPDNLTT